MPGTGDTAPTDAAGQVMAFADDDVTRQLLGRAASEMGWKAPRIETGGIDAAITRLAGERSPDLLFVDIGDSTDPLEKFNALADVCDAGTQVVALGNVNDLKLFRALTDAGVSDYLLKPVALADIARAVSAARSAPDGEVAPSRGRLVTVSGVRGGVGASQIAASLAWSAAEKQGLATALVDFDLVFGIASLIFDLEPGSGFTEILAQPDRIDSLFLERCGLKVGPRLSVFSAEAGLNPPPEIGAGAVAILFDALLGQFDAVVVDTPRSLLAAEPELLTRASTIVLATDLTLGAMRDCIRLGKLAEECGGAENLRLVASQSRPRSRGDLGIPEFQKAVARPVAATIPFDPKAVAQTGIQGRPPAAGKGSAAKALGKLASEIFSPQPASSSGARSGFFRRKAKQ